MARVLGYAWVLDFQKFEDFQREKNKCFIRLCGIVLEDLKEIEDDLE